MKNLFSKTLLCGVLATSFLLINCQKAPNRAVKAQINPTAKPSVKVGVCTEAIATDLDLLRKSDKKITDKLSTATDGASDVEVLNGLAIELNGLSKKILAAIALLKVDECKVHKDNDEKKELIDTAKAVSIRQNRSETGKKIKAKTKVPNVITIEDEAAETLKVGQIFTITKPLADALSDDASSKITVAIVDSNILSGTEADKALNDPNVTACLLKITKREEIKEGTKISIMSLVAGNDEKTKRNLMKVGITIAVKADGNSTTELTCNIADKKENESEKQVRKALGSLVVKEQISAEDRAKLEKDAKDTAEAAAIAKDEFNKASADAKTAREAADADTADAAKKEAADKADAVAKDLENKYIAAQQKADDAKNKLADLETSAI